MVNALPLNFCVANSVPRGNPIRHENNNAKDVTLNDKKRISNRFSSNASIRLIAVNIEFQ